MTSATHYDLELTFHRTSKTENCHSCFWKICVVERDTVKCKDGLDKIVEADGFDERCTVVVDFGFTSFGNLLTKRLCEGLVDTIRPTAGTASPQLYAFILLRSAFDFSFEVVAIRCSSAI